MNKQRALIIGSFVMIAGIVALYVFLGASEIAQNSSDADDAIEEVANVSNLVSTDTSQGVRGRTLTEQIDETFIARDVANIQVMTVVGENEVVFLENETKRVYKLDFREFFNEEVLYDLSETVAGTIEFAIIPESTYEDFIFLKVDGGYWVYFVDQNQLTRLVDSTTYVTYNPVTRHLYAVENGETADSRVVRYQIIPDFRNGYNLDKREVFAYGQIDKVYTSFDSVFISTPDGLFRYYDNRLFQVFESTATPRVSVSPQSNYAVVNDAEGNSFLYEFTDEEDTIIDLGVSFVPNLLMWGSNENFFEIQTGLLREFRFGDFLETTSISGEVVFEWPIVDSIVVQPFVYGIDSRDGIYFVDSEENFLRFISRISRFQ